MGSNHPFIGYSGKLHDLDLRQRLRAISQNVVKSRELQLGGCLPLKGQNGVVGLKGEPDSVAEFRRHDYVRFASDCCCNLIVGLLQAGERLPEPARGTEE